MRNVQQTREALRSVSVSCDLSCHGKKSVKLQCKIHLDKNFKTNSFFKTNIKYIITSYYGTVVHIVS